VSIPNVTLPPVSLPAPIKKTLSKPLLQKTL